MTDPLQDPGVQGLAQLGRNAIERVAQLEHWLGNLLAVIHRDGGHYESEHGTEKACADAETAVHVLRGSLEGYVEANRHMKGELDDALEDARKYCEAKGEIARLRDRLDAALSQSSLFGDALHAIINRCEGMANRIASAALVQVAEVSE